MPDIHAKQFSPSGAVKWLNCPGSALLEATLPDTASSYAKEGTLAHSLAELKLQKKFEPMSQSTYTRRFNKIKKDEFYQSEMDRHTDTYLDYVTEIAYSFRTSPFVAIEKRVSFENYAPGGFGTADSIVIGDKTMHVIDFKYGKGKRVEAECNPQGMLYALGALHEYGLFYQIDDIVISIVQPRIDNISQYVISRNDLESWAVNIVRPAVDKILNNLEEFHPGDWCDKGFCKAAGRCRAQCNSHTALEDFREALPPLISDVEIGDVLKRAESLKKWVSKLEEYALTAVLDGKNIPGWKVVEGRSIRAFKDSDEALDRIIQSGYDESLLYERNPLSLSKLEKQIGKQEFTKLVGDLIIKSPGKPTLVVENDKREPYKIGAVKDFENIGGNENVSK